MNITDIAWMAGIFDGEGSARIHRSTKRRQKTYTHFFAHVEPVNNTDTAIIDRVKGLLAELQIASSTRLVGSKNPNHSPCYQVRVIKRDGAMAFLQTVMPYLTGKKKLQAESVMSFYRLRIGRSGKRYNHALHATMFDQDEALYKSQPITNARQRHAN